MNLSRHRGAGRLKHHEVPSVETASSNNGAMKWQMQYKSGPLVSIYLRVDLKTLHHSVDCSFDTLSPVSINDITNCPTRASKLWAGKTPSCVVKDNAYRSFRKNIQPSIQSSSSRAESADVAPFMYAMNFISLLHSHSQIEHQVRPVVRDPPSFLICDLV